MSGGRLNSWKDYFLQVVEPNYQEFMSSSSSFKTALNLAVSLFSVRDWVYQTDKAAALNVMGKTFQSSTEFWNAVEAQVPEAAFIRDVANASKHVVLTMKPSTSMTHIANTFITSTGYGMGVYGAGRYGTSSVMMQDQGKDVSFDQCATEVYNFWKGFLAKNP